MFWSMLKTQMEWEGKWGWRRLDMRERILLNTRAPKDLYCHAVPSKQTKAWGNKQIMPLSPEHKIVWRNDLTHLEKAFWFKLLASNITSFLLYPWKPMSQAPSCGLSSLSHAAKKVHWPQLSWTVSQKEGGAKDLIHLWLSNKLEAMGKWLRAFTHAPEVLGPSVVEAKHGL